MNYLNTITTLYIPTSFFVIPILFISFCILVVVIILFSQIYTLYRNPFFSDADKQYVSLLNPVSRLKRSFDFYRLLIYYDFESGDSNLNGHVKNIHKLGRLLIILISLIIFIIILSIIYSRLI